MRARRVGDRVDVEFIRKGERKSSTLALRGLPFERSDAFDIVYGEVSTSGGVRRTILTKPRDSRRHPAVVLIGGIGCYSVDQPLNPGDAYRTLLESFTRRGFVTLRVEKSGMGDSTGEACATVNLDTEVKGLVAGLRQLKQQAFVDPTRVFIFGHSIGGVTGPLVASQERVRGLLVLETTGISWFEYELINARRQLVLAGTPPAETGAALIDKEWCSHRLLIEREPRETILKTRPACEEHMAYPASDAYVQQVAAQNLEGLWAKLEGTDVGVIYGSADYVTGVAESRAVVDAVNSARPGKGTYIEIADMDHFLTQAKSQKESMAAVQSGKPRPLHPGLAGIAGEWLTKVACGSSRVC
jgi:alpha-beta hydrolase superfamily lysophospholipase